MKKQILLLAVFTLATLFAGTNKVFGQDVDYLDAVPIVCTTADTLLCGSTDALYPVAGTEYPYVINSSSTGSIHWFVTDDADIITTQGVIAAGIEPSDGSGDYILTAGSTYNDVSNTSDTVKITWKSFDGVANDVILVAYVTDSAGCTDNIEVFRIEPTYSFTLDIAAINDAGTAVGDSISDCVNPVQSATYDGTTLTVDYGTDYVFFAVNAANWQTSWMPDDFDVSTDGSSTVTITGWAYPDEAATTGTWRTVGTDAVEASAYASGSDGWIDGAGECIIVRVQVDHGTVTENLVDETISLTVNGEMINSASTAYDGTYPDLDEGGVGNSCISDLTTDNADYLLTPRPNITEDTPSPFEDKTPNDN